MADYKDADWLRKKYWDEGLTTHEMGNIVDMNHGTIVYWMDKHNIPRRSIEDINKERRLPYATYYIKDSGHEAWKSSDTSGGEDYCAVHRLAAVSWFGLDAVVGKDVHHKNGIPWDNRESNLEPKTDTEHMKHHANEFGDKDGIESNFAGLTDYDGVTPERIIELYHEKGMSQQEVADELGVSRGVIRVRMDKWDIEARDKKQAAQMRLN